MKEIELTPKAEEDMEAIWDYTCGCNGYQFFDAGYSFRLLQSDNIEFHLKRDAYERY
ncbi:TPA: hypothetical protein ACOEME_004699 [Enterobacter cloacae subsp. dissolvens]